MNQLYHPNPLQNGKKKPFAQVGIRLRHPTLQEICSAHDNLRRDGKHFRGICPGCGKENTFVVYRDTGAIWCWQCEPNSKTVKGRNAYKAILKALGLDMLPADEPAMVCHEPALNSRTGQDRQTMDETARKAQSFWQYCVDYKNTAGDDYLSNRGLTTQVANMRFRADALHGEIPGYHPALVACLRNTRTGTIQAVQKMFIGVSKDLRKRYIGSPNGAGVNVSGTSDQLCVVSEGVENAIALKQAGVKGSIWATGGATFMKKFQMPPCAKSLVIASDPDDVGKNAAISLARRVNDTGLNVRIVKPQENVGDWNDMLLQGLESEINRRVRPG